MRETLETAGEEEEEDRKQREKEAKKSNLLSFFGHFLVKTQSVCQFKERGDRQMDRQKRKAFKKSDTSFSSEKKATDKGGHTIPMCVCECTTGPDCVPWDPPLAQTS